MSGGHACKCAERKKPVTDRVWRVLNRRCNYSAFNGRRYALSAYSCVYCLNCGNIWRTSADYVDELRDGSLKDYSASLHGRHELTKRSPQ